MPEPFTTTGVGFGFSEFPGFPETGASLLELVKAFMTCVDEPGVTHRPGAFNTPVEPRKEAKPPALGPVAPVGVVPPMYWPSLPDPSWQLNSVKPPTTPPPAALPLRSPHRWLSSKA